MEIVSWSLFGATIGVIAHFLDPKVNKTGIAFAMLLGITGAVVGGVIAYLILGNINTLSLSSLSIACASALIVLLMGRVIVKNKE